MAIRGSFGAIRVRPLTSSTLASTSSCASRRLWTVARCLRVPRHPLPWLASGYECSLWCACSMSTARSWPTRWPRWSSPSRYRPRPRDASILSTDGSPARLHSPRPRPARPQVQRSCHRHWLRCRRSTVARSSTRSSGSPDTWTCTWAGRGAGYGCGLSHQALSRL